MEVDPQESFALSDDELPSAPTSRPVARVPGLSVLDTFAVERCQRVCAVAHGDASNSDVHADVPVQPGDVVHLPDISGSKPASRRGRPKGSAAAAMIVHRARAAVRGEQPEPMGAARSRKDIALAASQAAAAKRKAQRLPQRSATPCSEDVTGHPFGPVALVPFDAGAAQARERLSIFQDTLAQDALIEWEKPAQPVDAHIEVSILSNILSLMTKTNLAKDLKVEKKVITRRFRVIALCIILARRRRTEKRILNIETL